MPNHETIHDLADRAVSDPENISIADRVRLGAWVVDRQEHIAAHKQAMADASGQPSTGPSELVKRMTPPAKALPSAVDEVDHGTDPVVHDDTVHA